MADSSGGDVSNGPEVSCGKCDEFARLLAEFDELVKRKRGGRNRTNGGGGGGVENDDEVASAGEMDNEASPADSYTLSQLDHDLRQFRHFAKENRLTDEELATLCAPLLAKRRRMATTKEKTRRLRFGCAAFLLCILLCYVHPDIVAWHGSAAGRILLVSLLPVWDWTELKDMTCLMGRPSDIDPLLPAECTFCEFIKEIDATSDLDADYLSENFIRRHRPVILENAADGWKYRGNFSVVSEIMADPVLSTSVPCKLSTNALVASGADRLSKALATALASRDAYFVHFENCQYAAAKAFRKFFPRPGFLSAEIGPVQYSWLLVSNGYRVEKFKPLALRERVAVVGQLVGKNVFVLVPGHGCAGECGSLVVHLEAGEAIVLSSYWDLEYKPDPAGENIAVILESHY